MSGLQANQLVRIDEDTLFESGRRVEFALYDENERIAKDPWAVWPNDLALLLKQRRTIGTKKVERWTYRQQREEPEHYSETIKHGISCPCDACDEAVKKLLRACGVLPKGVK